jgi:hypothetical protein
MGLRSSQPLLRRHARPEICGSQRRSDNPKTVGRSSRTTTITAAACFQKDPEGAARPKSIHGRTLNMITIAFQRLLVITASGGTAVRYEHGNVRCPMCELCQRPHEKGSVKVVGTDGFVRRCKCVVCGTSFKAIGETEIVESGKTPDNKTAPEPAPYKENKSKSKKGRKNGNSSRARNRSRSL